MLSNPFFVKQRKALFCNADGQIAATALRNAGFIFVLSVKNYPNLDFDSSKNEPVGQKYDFLGFGYS